MDREGGLTVAPPALVAALLFGLFAFGGLFAALTKYGVGLEAIAAFLVLSGVIAVIGAALRSSIVAFGGLFAATFFGGWAIYTFAYLA